MEDGALHHPLEAGRRRRLNAFVVDLQIVQFVVEIFDQVGAQDLDFHVARLQHRGGVPVVQQAQQQVFQGGVFVLPLVRLGQGAMQSLF